MTAPDPGLTGLIATHRLWFNSRDGAGCYGCGWRSDVPPSEGLENLHHAHVALVVEQHTNGRTAELEATIARVEDAVRFAYSHRFDLDSTDIVGQGDPATGPNNFYNGVIYVSGKARAALEGEQQ